MIGNELKYKLTPIHFKVDILNKFKLRGVIRYKSVGYSGDDFAKHRATFIHKFISAN